MTIYQKHIDYSFWIKVYALLLVTFGFTLAGVAQPTFSKILNSGGNSLFSSVEIIDDNIYVAGGYLNPETGFNSCTYLYKYDNTANLIDSVVICDSSIEWRTRRGNIHILSDSTLVWVHSLEIDDYNEIVIHKLDLDLNITDTLTFGTPLVPDGHPFSDNMDIDSMVQENDSLYLGLTLYKDGNNVIGLMNISPNLDTAFMFMVEGGITHNPVALAKKNNDLIVCDLTAEIDNYFIRVMTLDTYTNELTSEFIFDIPEAESIALINDLIPLEDGLVGAGIGRQSGSSYAQPLLFKLTYSGTPIWWTLSENAVLGSHSLEAIDQTCDGGFIGFADWTVEIIEEDTVMSSDQTELLGIRYDSSGEILWERTFRFVDGQLVEHLPADVIATEDGGFVVVGHVSNSDLNDPENTFPFQRNLIFKVDACGCLVPGCDPLCELGDCKPEETWESEDYFIIGPNPTSDLLNLFLAPSDSRSNERVQIHDVTGKVIHDFSVSENGTTYMIDMSDEAPGIYVVSLRSELGIIQSERFIVE